MDLFAQNLKTLRKRLGLQQADMEKELGYSRTRWSSYESGEARPKFEDLIKICNYFKVSETDILRHNLGDQQNHKSRKGSTDGYNWDKQNTSLISLHEKEITFHEKQIERLKKLIENIKLGIYG